MLGGHKIGGAEPPEPGEAAAGNDPNKGYSADTKAGTPNPHVNVKDGAASGNVGASTRAKNDSPTELPIYTTKSALKNAYTVNGGGGDKKSSPDGYQMSPLDYSRSTSVLDKKKPFARLSDESRATDIAKEIVFGKNPWIPNTPDALITFISGNEGFDKWRRDDLRSALRAGIIKLFGTLSVVMLDDGLQYGLSQLIGAAVREEELYRITPDKKGKPPLVPLIGMVPVSRLNDPDYPSYPDYDDSSSLNNAETGNNPVAKYQLNAFHSHYVYLSTPSYRECGLLRVTLEMKIREELGVRASMGNDGINRKVIPLIAFLFQSELEDLYRVRSYLQNGVPMVILEGCGGIADILAAALSDSVEFHGNRLKNSVEGRLQKSYPHLRNGDHLGDMGSLVMEILGLANNQGGPSLLSTIDCRKVENFANLNSAVLKNAILSSTANATPDRFATFINLAIKCNKPDIANSLLLSKPPWSNMPLPASAFELALLLPNREAFIDTFLLQKFPIRYYLSHLRYLKLFREAKDRNFFPETIWEGALRYSLARPIGESFVISDLNRVVELFTGVHNYLDMHQLSCNAFDRPGQLDPITAERKAMDALLVFAAVFNRPKLVHIFVKYSDEPLVQALFAESLFHGMYRHGSNVAVNEMLKNTANAFAKTAVDIFDSAVAVSPVRGHAVLTSRFADFNNKTPLELAYDTNNKQFVAHNNVQTWLDQYYFNFIKVKGNFDNLKLFISAIFMFPMYIWLTFPRLRQQPPVSVDNPSDGVYRPKGEAEIQKVLSKVKHIQSGEVPADHSVQSVVRPPFLQMLSAVWAAPVVRFYTWHLFYWMFIILICVDIMLPPCRFVGVDIAVFVLTISMWAEILLRTIYDYQLYRRVDWIERAYDLISQTLFNILFFLYRIAPYRYDHPFAGRVILAFGILYYCYRVWGWFYYMEKTIGPLIRVTIQMFTLDLSRWILLMIPFIVATAVIWQGVINPDWPNTGDDWRHAFYRGIFTLFGSFSNELEYVPTCELGRVRNVSGPDWIHRDRFGRPDAIPPDRCWSGDYDSYSCPTVSFWSYFFVIQYYVFLKLGMGSMLTAFYVVRNLAEARNAASVWKYHRCRIIMDYAGRSSLPPPFFALGYIYKIIVALTTKRPVLKERSMIAGNDQWGHESDLDAVSFTYWKGVAQEYYRKKEQMEAAGRIPQEQVNALVSVQEDLGVLSKKIASADRKVLDVEESTKSTGYHMQDAAAQMKANKVNNISAIAEPWPHKLSRSSPYPGTTLTRMFVPDSLVEWKMVYPQYRPDTYSKRRSERGDGGGDRSFMDSESLADSRGSSSEANFRTLEGYRSSSGHLDDDDAVLAQSWTLDSNGAPVQVQYEPSGSPLNPFGRTGLRGRGTLPNFGPNHKVYLLITTRSLDGFRYIVQTISGRANILPQAYLGDHDSEFALGSLLLDAFLFDSRNLTGKELDMFNDKVHTVKVMQEVMESMLKSRLSSIMDDVGRRSVSLRQVYRGYCDNALNTDNAWLEAALFHVNIPAFGIDKFKNYRWREYSPDIGLPEFDAAAVRQVALEWGM